jgi:hypothetical protein
MQATAADKDTKAAAGKTRLGIWAAAAVTGLALAGCASTGHPASNAAKSPAAAATHSQSCADQVHTWAHDQGLAQLHQLSHDTGAISKDALKVAAALGSGSSGASQLAAWQADATALETDAQAAASNPPPACADAADYGTAMQDYTTAAKDEISAVNDINSGSYGAAGTLITAGTSALDRGTSALGRATAAINGLGG